MPAGYSRSSTSGEACTSSPTRSCPRSSEGVKAMADLSARSHVYVGAASGALGGLYRRAVADDRWDQLTKGLPEATQVHAISVHPTNADVLYVGTQHGAFRSTDRGERWERLDVAEGDTEVWSILVHPASPRTVFAGASPVAVHRSDDGGDTWRRLAKAARPDPVRMAFACRVTRLAADPVRPAEP